MILVIMLVIWGVALYVGHEIGKSKGRSGFWWAFWLGWVGVIVVALLPSKGTDDEITRLEREVQIAKLRRERNELHYANPPEGYRYRPDGQLEADV